MPRFSRARLAALNAALLLTLVALALIPVAGAAPAAADPAQPEQRARGDYTMVSGRLQGSNTNALYIIDAANQELVALRWDIGRNGLIPIGYRSLVADAKSARGNR